MQTKHKFTAAILIVLTCIGIAAYRTYMYVVELGYPSCLGSLHEPIRRQKATQDLAEKADDWKILSDAEFELVMQDVRGGDCKNFPDPKLDAQNNRINIAVRRDEKRGGAAVMIWSNGRDGISGNDDDVVVPFSQRAPYR